MLQGAIIFVIGILLFYFGINAFRKSRRVINADAIPLSFDFIHEVLTNKVKFYNALSNEDQNSFANRVQQFLSRIKITPVKGAALTSEDTILIGAAGVIPLFHYKNWFYNNLNEVLVYPETFNRDYASEGADRDITGMIGDGAMHRTMILSLPYLRMGFAKGSGSNTAIHEFAHLLDKSDGATDGVPELILQDDNIKPWISSMHHYIKMLRKDSSDIDPYGATNEAEFFAVMSEYFFQKPGKLKEKHPELYRILEEAFENKPQ